MICPTPCDDDCDVLCHEGHEVTWKREHQPEDCPSAAQHGDPLAGLPTAEVWTPKPPHHSR